MDGGMDMTGGLKGRGVRAAKKTELETLDNADLAKIVDPDSEYEESHVFSYSLSVVEDAPEVDGNPSAQSSHAESQLANWGPLGQRFDLGTAHFSGRPGPTYFGEDMTTAEKQATLSEQRKSKLYCFKKFFTADCVNRVVTQTNRYVKRIVMMPRPEQLNPRYAWPPKWAVDWEELTETKLMRWLALLLYMAHHPVEYDEDLWSDHWFQSHPGAHRFMTLEEHTAMKAAIHFQSEQENRQDPDTPELVPKKIGLLMKMMRDSFKLHYSPAEVS
eukprot:705750-Rhodomonas_salina.8